MGLKQTLNTVFSKKRPKGGVQVGVARGRKVGHFGVWALLPKDGSKEALRIMVRWQANDGTRHSGECSYTLAPSKTGSFCRGLEMPLAFREFMTGRRRAQTGTVQFDYIFTDGANVTTGLKLGEALRIYRGKARVAPAACRPEKGYLLPDPTEVASLFGPAIKAYCDKVRAEWEEKARLEEEERKKKEAEAQAKAAAAKALAAKPAAAKTAKAEGAPSEGPKPPTLSAAKVGLFYGTSTGNTEDIANQIKTQLGDVVEHVKNVTEIVPADLTVCEVLILGVPTWHIGEMQDDWAVILPDLDKLNFAGKKVAVFGLGDQKGYPDTYVDAMGELLEKFEKTGAKLHGLWPTDGYVFQKSKGMRDGKFLGLVIDIENQNDKTPQRVQAWCQQIKKELSL